MLRAHDGSVVDGDPDHAIEKTDFWSFTRDTRVARPELGSGGDRQRLIGQGDRATPR